VVGETEHRRWGGTNSVNKDVDSGFDGFCFYIIQSSPLCFLYRAQRKGGEGDKIDFLNIKILNKMKEKHHNLKLPLITTGILMFRHYP
jgi:hypothetical protein